MTHTDLYGLAITTESSEAASAYCKGMDLTLAAWSGAEAEFDRAISADPAFALARVSKATALSAAQRHEEARAEIQKAASLIEKVGTAREESHINIVRLVNLGKRTDAIEKARHHIEEWPRDAFIFSFLLGAFGLLAFSGMHNHDQARVDLCNRHTADYGDDWWFLTFKGWADAENGSHALGREQLERALAMRSNNANAAHSLVHAMFEDGSSEDAAALIDRWLPGYEAAGPLYSHISWHEAWLALDRGESDRALHIYQSRLTPTAAGVGYDAASVLADAAALLWRMRAYGYDIPKEYWTEIASFAQKAHPKAGFSFVDVHMSFIAGATGDFSHMDARLAHQQELLSADALPGGEMVPAICQAMLSFAQGDYGKTVRLIDPVMGDVVRLGGSGAQRSLIEDTYIFALINSGEPKKAAAFLDKRLHKRASPKDRSWHSSLMS